MSKTIPRLTSPSLMSHLIDNTLLIVTLIAVSFSMLNFWHFLPILPSNSKIAIDTYQKPVMWINLPPESQSKPPSQVIDLNQLSNTSQQNPLNTKLVVVPDNQLDQFSQSLRDQKLNQPNKIASNIYQLKTTDEGSKALETILETSKFLSTADDELTLLQEKSSQIPTDKSSLVLTSDTDLSIPTPDLAEKLTLPSSTIPQEITNQTSLESLNLLSKDQFIGSQWHITNQKINQPNNKKPIIVAVIDGGVDISHPDLAGVIAKNSTGQILGWNYWDNTSIKITDTSSKLDEAYGHGTHIAGTIGAQGNTLGVRGSCEDTCQIMPLKVFGGPNSSGSISKAVMAIDYAVTNGAKIINLSWGSRNLNTILEATIKKAQSQGVIFVAAAGNNGEDSILYPARLPDVISVGSIDSLGNKSKTTNYGAGITRYSPGVDILSTSIPSVGTCSPEDRGFDLGLYSYCSGTSMATGVASGQKAKELWSRE